MTEFTLWDILSNLLLAARWTVALSLIAFTGGGLLGLLVAAARISVSRWVRYPARLYIEIFQGTPLLMQMFLAFFGLSLFGIELPPLAAASLALILYTSAYLGEIWRGCIEAIPRGQWQAALSLGFSRAGAFRELILPQALRIAVAPTVGFAVQVVKGTALASIIGFVDVTKAGGMITNATFRPFLVYALVAALYFLLCFPLSWYSRRLETRFRLTAH
jgi:polar amino acid transport system permease protein